MRISDWSSDVCSSDLIADHPHQRDVEPHIGAHADRADHQQGCDRIDAVIDEIAIVGPLDAAPAREAAVERIAEPGDEIGRASWRERGCQYVEMSVVDVALKNKHNTKETNTTTT